MAETPEDKNTPEASADEVGRGDERNEAVPETVVDDVSSASGDEAVAASEEGAGDTTVADASTESSETEAAPAAAAPAGATRRERLEQRRTERRSKEAAGRGPRTPEERDAARREGRKEKAAQRRRYRARLKTKRDELRAAQPAQEPDHAPEHGPGRAKVRTGLVVSDKADKTIVVRIDYQRRHRRYRKILRSSVTLHAHDEANNARAGDTVQLQECRPMSRTKRWRLVDVLERAK
jgi:small subunit ribosomal protein S17